MECLCTGRVFAVGNIGMLGWVVSFYIEVVQGNFGAIVVSTPVW